MSQWQNNEKKDPIVHKTLPSNVGSESQGAKNPHALQPRNQNIKQNQYFKKFNKDFKNGTH